MPLRQLLYQETRRYWEKAQQNAVQQLEEIFMSSEFLAHNVIMTPAAPQSTGLDCYISRSLSDSEENYFVTEKEALFSTLASEQGKEYILRLRFTLETDQNHLDHF